METTDQNHLQSMQAQAESEGRQCVVGAFIRDEQGRILAQKRGPDRKLYPNCWDVIGGHVDPGESITTALEREIEEETGWVLKRIAHLVDVWDWESEQGERKREFDFLVEVEGDLAHPRLEWSKHTAFRWIHFAELDLFKEQWSENDDRLYQVVKKALEWQASK